MYYRSNSHKNKKQKGEKWNYGAINYESCRGDALIGLCNFKIEKRNSNTNVNFKMNKKMYQAYLIFFPLNNME